MTVVDDYFSGWSSYKLCVRGIGIFQTEEIWLGGCLVSYAQIY